jgi:hypothetical protein
MTGVAAYLDEPRARVAAHWGDPEDCDSLVSSHGFYKRERVDHYAPRRNAGYARNARASYSTVRVTDEGARLKSVGGVGDIEVALLLDGAKLFSALVSVALLFAAALFVGQRRYSDAAALGCALLVVVALGVVTRAVSTRRKRALGG